MKLRFLVAFFAVFYLVSCQKDGTPPDRVSSLLGTYTMTTFTLTSAQPFPTTGKGSGNAVIAKNGTDLNTIKFTVSYTLTNSGVETKLTQTQVVDLRPIGSSFDLYQNATKIGTLTASVITVNKYVLNGFTVDFTAMKQ